MIDPRKVLDKEFGKTDLPIDTDKARKILDAHSGASMLKNPTVVSNAGKSWSNPPGSIS